MAYINAIEVKAIRQELKAKFPKCKFSVRMGAGSHSVQVNLMKGPEDMSDIIEGSRYAPINENFLRNYGNKQKFFSEVVDVIKTAPGKVGDAWYDRSDAMTDYFDTAFYIHFNVGSFKRGYEVV
tara:strand:- start:412 stop:783 length:372 start_codon:yes stop_codon:yes gene_type:complete